MSFWRVKKKKSWVKYYLNDEQNFKNCENVEKEKSLSISMHCIHASTSKYRILFFSFLISSYANNDNKK